MTQLKDVIHFYLGCELYWVFLNETSVLDVSLLKDLQNHLHQIKPILRRLDSMTEEELKECVILSYFERNRDIISQCFDEVIISTDNRNKKLHGTAIPYTLFKDGKHFMTATLSENHLNPEQFLYLLKQGFDLFNLIDSNQAIDKNKITTP